MATVPLARALTDAGYGARRRVVVLIKAGLVQVNGEVAESYTQPVDPTTDKVVVAGKRTGEERPRRVYIAMNKPDGYLTTTEDDRGRPTVIDLLPESLRKAGLHPAGRLDEDSTGLLILTNDGQLTYELTHPRFEHQKEYYVALTGSLPDDDRRRLEAGVEIEGQVTWPAKVRQLEGESPYSYSVTIHEGRKRQVRMMFAAVNQHVAMLKRVRLGGLTLGSISEGQYRELTRDEVRRLTRPPAKPQPIRGTAARSSTSGRERGASYDRRPDDSRPRYRTERQDYDDRRGPARPSYRSDRTEGGPERPPRRYSERPPRDGYDDRRGPARPSYRSERTEGGPERPPYRYTERPPRGDYDDRRGPARPSYRSERTEGGPERPPYRYTERPPRDDYDDRRGPARPSYRSERTEGGPERPPRRYSERSPRDDYDDRRGPARPSYRSDRSEVGPERPPRRYSERPPRGEYEDRRGPARPSYRSDRSEGGPERPPRRYSERPPRGEYEDRRGPERPRYRSDRDEAAPQRRAPAQRPTTPGWDRDNARASRYGQGSHPTARGDFEGGSGPDRRERRPVGRPPARGSGISDRPGAARQGRRTPGPGLRSSRPMGGGASRPPSRPGPATRGTQRRTSPGEGRRPPSERR